MKHFRPLRTQSLLLTLPTGHPLTLSYRYAGDPTNPAVMCVHGLTRNGRDFDRMALALEAEGFFVLCPDMPGRGGSSNLPADFYHYGIYIFCLQALLAHYGKTSTAWLGTSMGGLIAMMLNTMNPTLIQCIVLNDVGPKMSRESLQQIVDYAGNPPICDTYEEAARAVKKSYNGFGIDREDEWEEFISHSIHQLDDGRWAFSYDPAVVAPLAIWLEQNEDTFFDMTPAWQSFACPQLIVRGEKSEVLTAGTAEWMAAQSDDIELITFSHCGHAPALMREGQMSPVAKWLKHYQNLVQ